MVPVLAAAYLGPLLADHDGWGATTASVLYVIPACVVTGEAVAWVSDQLRRTHRDLLRAQEALVRGERLAAIGEMASVIGHELRNPLGALSNFHYMAQRSLDDPGAVEQNLAMAELQVARAVNLTENLTTFMTEHDPVPADLELRAVVDDVLDAAPPPSGVDILVTELPRLVYADAVQLAEMLALVVTNAYEAMPSGGFLRISGSETHRYTDIVVEDTGDGVDSAVASRVFEPFVTTKTSGTGLGLAIVHRLALAHRGSVSITNRPQGGATVAVRLPRNPAEVPLLEAHT